MSVEDVARRLYDEFGQRKRMGGSALDSRTPHYFLLRTFLGDNDLAVLLNTKRCRYNCPYCELPAKSSKKWISAEDILAQFLYILHEVKHALSILDRVSLSNEGSVLDTTTMPMEALVAIARCVYELRRVRTLVLETRLEFVSVDVIQEIQRAAPRLTLNILAGFETQDAKIRTEILDRRESLETVLTGLDGVAETGATLGAYVLFKPSPAMSDDEAFVEADRTIDYLAGECRRRHISLYIRLNPMYVATGSKWGELAAATPDYQPPRLTDVMRLAEKKAREGVPIYIGLSTEGLGENWGTYLAREDYSPGLVRPIKLFNDGKILSFDWEALAEPAVHSR